MDHDIIILNTSNIVNKLKNKLNIYNCNIGLMNVLISSIDMLTVEDNVSYELSSELDYNFYKHFDLIEEKQFKITNGLIDSFCWELFEYFQEIRIYRNGYLNFKYFENINGDIVLKRI